MVLIDKKLYQRSCLTFTIVTIPRWLQLRDNYNYTRVAIPLDSERLKIPTKAVTPQKL